MLTPLYQNKATLDMCASLQAPSMKWMVKQASLTLPLSHVTATLQGTMSLGLDAAIIMLIPLKNNNRNMQLCGIIYLNYIVESVSS